MNNNPTTITADLVIIGGGIAGIWLLNILLARGFNAILLESQALGGKQTIHSQGIIHGGMKYALQGVVGPASDALNDAPDIWRNSLAGTGDIDLSAVKVLSDSQYLWNPSKLRSKISRFFANTVLSNKITAINSELWPAIFNSPHFNGQVYKLPEMVLDVHSLLTQLVTPHLRRMIKIDNPHGVTPIIHNDHIESLEILVNQQRLRVQAGKYIFTAGSCNAALCHHLPQAPNMQLRPLHMVTLRSPALLPLYAHCLGLSAMPRITITSHYDQHNNLVWYLGGKLAEDGVKLSSSQLSELALQEINALFPWLNLNNPVLHTHFIERAEAKTPNQQKPNNASCYHLANAIIAWPTKLALAPLLANDIVQQLTSGPSAHTSANRELLDKLPRPAIATPLWNTK